MRFHVTSVYTMYIPCSVVDVQDPSLYPRHAPWSAGHYRIISINWADRLAILTLEACHVQTCRSSRNLLSQFVPCKHLELMQIFDSSLMLKYT